MSAGLGRGPHLRRVLPLALHVPGLILVCGVGLTRYAEAGGDTASETRFRLSRGFINEAELTAAPPGGSGSTAASAIVDCPEGESYVDLALDVARATLRLDDARLCGLGVAFFGGHLEATDLTLAAGLSGGFASVVGVLDVQGGVLFESVPIELAGTVRLGGGPPYDAVGLAELDLAGRFDLDEASGRYLVRDLAGSFPALPLPLGGATLSGTITLNLESMRRVPGPVFAADFEDGRIDGWQAAPGALLFRDGFEQGSAESWLAPR